MILITVETVQSFDLSAWTQNETMGASLTFNLMALPMLLDINPLSVFFS